MWSLTQVLRGRNWQNFWHLGQEGFLGSGTLPVLLNQIKSWKHLLAHPLWIPVPVPLFNNKHDFTPGWPSSSQPRRGCCLGGGQSLPVPCSLPGQRARPCLFSRPCYPACLGFISEYLTLRDPTLPLDHGLKSFEGLRKPRGVLLRGTLRRKKRQTWTDIPVAYSLAVGQVVK